MCRRRSCHFEALSTVVVHGWISDVTVQSTNYGVPTAMFFRTGEMRKAKERKGVMVILSLRLSSSYEIQYIL